MESNRLKHIHANTLQVTFIWSKNLAPHTKAILKELNVINSMNERKMPIVHKTRKETGSKWSEISILSATWRHFKLDNALSSPSINSYQFMSHSVSIQQLAS